jgi:small-conductance mechanosensitive channel
MMFFGFKKAYFLVKNRMTSSLLHRFSFSLLLILIVQSILPSIAFAEQQDKVIETDAIVQPLPLRLTPKWWDQFGQSSHKKLAEQVELLVKELNLINTPEKARYLASQVMTLLEQYETKRNTPLPVKKSVKNKEKRIYFLDDIFKLIKQKKSIHSSLQLLKANLSFLHEEIKKENNTLNTIKLNYLKNNTVDTDKLIEGLEWIKARLNLSILKLSEKNLLSQKTRLNDTLQALQEENTLALDELVIKEKKITESKLFVNILEGTIRSATKEFQQLKSNERSIVATNSDEKNKKQLLSLEALEKSVSIKKLRTERLIHLLVYDINRLQKNSLEIERSNIIKNLHQAISYKKETALWMKEIGNRVEKEENAINSFLALNIDKKQKKNNDDRLIKVKKIYAQGLALEEKQEKLHLLSTILDDKLGKTAKGAIILVEKADKTLRNSWKSIITWINTSLFSMGGTPVTPVGLFHFFVIIFVGWFISRLFLHAIRKVNNRTRGGMQESSIMTLGRIFSFVIIGISLLIAFSSLGVDVTKLALVASALSIGIGFGLQNIINNFVSGIILLFERSVKVGDYIMLADGTRGEVREINIRSTVVNTNDNIDVIVPNSEFVNNSVTNWTMNERFLRLKISFGVAYGTDKELIRRIIVDAALSLPYTLNLTERQYPQVRLKNFGESSLDFELVVWVKAEWANRPGRVKAAYNWEIETALVSNDIEIPFPQREVKLLGTTA